MDDRDRGIVTGTGAGTSDTGIDDVDELESSLTNIDIDNKGETHDNKLDEGGRTIEMADKQNRKGKADAAKSSAAAGSAGSKKSTLAAKKSQHVVMDIEFGKQFPIVRQSAEKLVGRMCQMINSAVHPFYFLDTLYLVSRVGSSRRRVRLKSGTWHGTINRSQLSK